MSALPDIQPAEGPPLEAVVRDRILTAALACFAKQGYAATALREVAEAAGVTKPMIYYYFGSKEGLYRAILETVLAAFRDRLDAALVCHRTLRARLIALAHVHREGSQEHPEVARFLLAHALGPSRGAPDFDLLQFHAAQARVIERALQDAAQEEGIVARNAHLFGQIFWGAMGVFCASGGADPHEPMPTPEQVVDMLWHGSFEEHLGSERES